MKKRGSITLVMSLVLMVILSLLAGGIRLSRVQCARVQAVSAAETGLYSLFSEYDQTLLEEYDLFFLDAGYGKESIDSYRVVEQIENSMSLALQTGITKCDLSRCSVTAMRLASDENGSAFCRQVTNAVKKQIATDAVSILKEKLWANQNLTKRQQEQTGDGPPPVDVPADTAEVALPEMSEESNPLEVIKEIKNQGILGLVLPSGTAVSEMEADVSVFTSHRSLQKGIGTLDAPDKSSLDKWYMQIYIMDKLGNYRKPQENGTLKYQAEYIIGAGSSDRENLKRTVNKILLIREAVNASYLFTDSAKRAQTSAAAAALCTLLLIPEGTAAVEKLLLLGWAYAESILDVRQLMEGGKIPAVKTAANWNLELSQFGNFFSMLQNSEKNDKNGLGYEEYLHLLMMPVSEKNITYRCMDMIEQNIRNISGNGNFCFDSCVEAIETEMVFRGPEGQEWTAVRDYGYDM